MAKETRKSHINGLPIVLESMLNHLLTISDLKSWSMYQNKDGLLSLNIRFSDILDDNVGIIDMPVSYRKVPARQLMRSRQRALDHNKLVANTHTPIQSTTHIVNMETQTENFDNHTTHKKRKISANCLSPETNRHEHDENNRSYINIDSPTIVAEPKEEYQDYEPDIDLKEYEPDAPVVMEFEPDVPAVTEYEPAVPAVTEYEADSDESDEYETPLLTLHQVIQL